MISQHVGYSSFGVTASQSIAMCMSPGLTNDLPHVQVALAGAAPQAPAAAHEEELHPYIRMLLLRPLPAHLLLVPLNPKP